jgi:hypothetical protein
MSRIIYREFRDEVAGTRYPFNDNATLRTTDGLFDLPVGTIVDASLFPIGATPPLYLSAITVKQRTLEFTISDFRRTVVASGGTDTGNAADTVTLVDAYERPVGVLVVDPDVLINLTAWPEGAHAFAQAAATFVPTCVIPAPVRGVQALVDKDGDQLFGDVWLVGDQGVIFRQVDAQTIRVDVVGDPLSARVLCDPLSLFKTPNFIRTINGCSPDRFGQFQLTAGDHENPATVLRIYPRNGRIVVELAGGE